LWRWLWISIVWSAALTAALLTIFPRQNSSWLKAASFLIAAWSTLPGLVQLSFFTSEEYLWDFSFAPWITGGLIYSVGAVNYSLGFPEKKYPKTFDFIGHSHNIFHLCVNVGSLIHFTYSLKAF
jgi:adiponectin receptor